MRLALAVITASVAAALITALSSTQSFADGLLRAEARSAVPEAAPVLQDASPAVNAAFLDYAGDTELVLSARLALHRYPAIAEEILALYGTEPEFRAILRRHGPAVIPPIHYFLENPIKSLRLRRATGGALSQASAFWQRWWSDTSSGDDAAVAIEADPLAPLERGWYAVQFIQDSGHNFLGQFETASDGRVVWIQSERVVEALNSFFTSGVRSLESRLRREGYADTSDYVWAGVDLAVVVGAAKLLRAGRSAARAGRGAVATTRLSRTALTARTVARGSRAALRVGKWGVPVAVGYAVIRHPGLISSLAVRVGKQLGMPPRLMQFGLWFLILSPVIWLVMRLWRWLVRPTGIVLVRTGRLLQRVRGPAQPAGNATADAAH